MSQQDLLKRVVAALERIGIDYMITGSVASSLQSRFARKYEEEVYEVQHSRLDQNYLGQWAAFLGVEQELQRIRNESEPI